MVAIATIYLLNNIYNIWLPSNQPRVCEYNYKSNISFWNKYVRELLDKNQG